jgi:autotransporter-associated beta strand protein
MFKKFPSYPFIRSCLRVVITVGLAASPVFAANYYNYGNNGSFLNVAAEYSNTDGSTVNATATPNNATTDLFFLNSTVGSSGALTFYTGNSSLRFNSMTFRSNVGSIQFDRNTMAAPITTASILMRGGGITMDAGAGPVTWGGTDQRVVLGAEANFTIANNSSSDLTFNREVQSVTNNTTFTITVAGSGSGNTIFYNIVTQSNGRETAMTINTSGSGIVKFVGNNTYLGATTINAGTLQLGDGGTAGALAAGSAITNNGTLVFNRSNTVTQGTNFASVIAGTGNLTQAGSGTLILSGNNTYTGTTTVSAGTLSLGGNQSLGAIAGSGSISLSSYNLSAASASSTTFSGVMSGTGAFTKSGIGTLTLSGNNTYSGTTTISAGTLAVGAGGTSGSTGSGNITITGPGLLAFNRSDTVAVAGAISGNGTLLQQGAGTLQLGGTNSNTGEINATAGTILFDGANALSGSVSQLSATNATLSLADGTARTITLTSSDLALDNGAFVFDIGATSDRITLSSGAATMLGTNTVNLNFLSFINAPGSWTLLSAASGLDGSWSLNDSFTGVGQSGYTFSISSNATTLTLTAAHSSTNTYWKGNLSGNWSQTSGGLSNWTSDASGTISLALPPDASSDVIFSASGSSNLTTSLGGDLTVKTLTISDSNGVTIQAGNTLTANATNFAAFNITAPSGTTTINASLAGAGAGLSKSGAGTLVLGGTNTYGGGTTLNAGTLTIHSDAALGATSGGITIAPGAGSSMTLSAGSDGIALNANRTVTISSGTLVVNSGTNNLTVAGDITGGGALSKSGAGALILTASNTYTGQTTISAGTLQLGAGGTSGSLSPTSSISNNGTLVFNRSDTATQGTDFASTISGTGGLTQAGSGTLILSGGNTYTGATTIHAGALQIGSGSTTGNLSTSSAITVNGTLVFNRSNAVTQGTDFASSIGGTGNLTKAGAGTLTLSGNNSYTGTTTINAGTIRLDNSASNSQAIVGDITISGGQLSLAITNQIADTASVTLTSGSIELSSYNETINSLTMSGGSLRRSTNTLTLNSASSFTGGALNFASNTARIITNATSTLGNVTFDFSVASGTSTSGLQLGGDIAGNNGTTTNFTNSGGGLGRINLNGADRVIDVGAGATMNVGWTIVGTSAGITKNGSGSLVLSANNTYSGVTTINGGTIEITTTGLLGGGSYSGNIVNTGAFLIGSNSNQTLSGAISGIGALTKNGTGTLTLAGNNNFSGGTTLNTGTLVIGNAAAAGTGTITQANGSSLLKIDTTGTITNDMSVYNVLSTQSATLSGAITVNNATWDIDTGDTLTISGAVSGNGGVTKNGGGTLTLNGTNTYNGSTVVNAGTLHAASAGALGSNNTVQVTGGSLLVSADNALNNKFLTLNSTSIAGLAFSGNYSGRVNNLTLSQNSIIDLGDGSVSIMFDTFVMNSYTLDIYNWTGTTLWGGGTGNDTDKVYFGDDLSDAALAKIYFHSGAVGGGDSFLGSGFELMPQTTFDGGLGYQIIPVPEPETYATGLLLLLGGAWWMWRYRKLEAGNRKA